MRRHRHRAPTRILALFIACATAVVASVSGVTGPGSAEAATMTTTEAVNAAVANAAGQGVTSYLSVVDRGTGEVVAETGNARTQVASESVIKLLIAAYHLVRNGGYASTPASTLARLDRMLRVSDDDIASAMFTTAAIPTIASRYGMGNTSNATGKVGQWGAARITAHDMTTFMWRASQDPAVGPWLIPAMARTERFGSDGFDQGFGLATVGGDHGSKQGWGSDSYFTPQHNAIHSVGYTDRFFVAILQTSNRYAVPMRDTATAAAQLIASSTGNRPAEGSFVQNAADGTIYRMVGGAPIYVSDFAAVPGSTSFRTLSGAAFALLPQFPADGTLLQAGGRIYVVAGGAPVYLSNYDAIHGYRPALEIDPAAVARAGGNGQWSHLAAVPRNGTLLQAGSDVFIAVGGAPVYVSDYAAIGGFRPSVLIDPVAVQKAGSGEPWNHLRAVPADGTVLSSGGHTWITAGGAPTYVLNPAAIGNTAPDVLVDPAALAHGGEPGVWSHLRLRPADGTLLLTGEPVGAVYVVAGGAPVYVSDMGAVGGWRPTALVDPFQIALAGTGGSFDHLLFRPADGTIVKVGDTLYRIRGGAPERISASAARGGSEPVRVDGAAITNAGGPNQWSHLARR